MPPIRPAPALLLPVCLLAAAPALAAQADAPEPARVMVLGVYHFANPGLDVAQFRVADVLSPEKQEEIDRVVEGLARFRPTRVAVERRPEAAPALDSLYAAWREGRHEPARDETQQLGFRLAGRFDHPRLHPIDHGGDFPMEAVMAWAGENDPAFVERFRELVAGIEAEMESLQRTSTVAQILRNENDPARLRFGHGWYVETAGVGEGGDGPGADLLAAWYERNVRMFANLARVAEPGERVVVIVGAGHAPILRELIAAHPRMELVDPLEYLPER